MPARQHERLGEPVAGGGRPGDVGAPMSVNVPGGPCGKTIVRTGMHGPSCRMTWPAAKPTDGGKTAWPVSATGFNF